MSDWIKRPDLNWCSNCWFGANIESKQTPIGVKYICHNCGIFSYKYNDGSVLSKEIPQHFSDEEWQKYWEMNFKAKEK